MSSDTTSLNDLQVDPVGSNVSMVMSEPAQQPNAPPPFVPPASAVPTAGGGGALDESTIQQLITGIQKASMSGLTQLPSRDIPMTTTGLTTDSQTMPNFVPPPPPAMADYIGSEVCQPGSAAARSALPSQDSMEDMYADLQAPLLLAVLYFLFQLPFVRRFLFRYVPMLFTEDANYNLYGFLFCSVMFGLTYHTLSKGTKFFNRF